MISGKGDIRRRKLWELVSLRKKWQRDRGGVDGWVCGGACTHTPYLDIVGWLFWV